MKLREIIKHKQVPNYIVIRLEESISQFFFDKITKYSYNLRDLRLLEKIIIRARTSNKVSDALNKALYNAEILEKIHKATDNIAKITEIKNNLDTKIASDVVINALEKALFEECPICFENLATKKYYKCRHLICVSCHTNCVNIGHRTCAICRADEQF